MAIYELRLQASVACFSIVRLASGVRNLPDGCKKGISLLITIAPVLQRARIDVDIKNYFRLRRARSEVMILEIYLRVRISGHTLIGWTAPSLPKSFLFSQAMCLEETLTPSFLPVHARRELRLRHSVWTDARKQFQSTVLQTETVNRRQAQSLRIVWLSK